MGKVERWGLLGQRARRSGGARDPSADTEIRYEM